MTPMEQAAREFPDPRFKCSCNDEDWTCLFHQDLAAFLVQAIARARREEREAIKETLCESCKQAV